MSMEAWTVYDHPRDFPDWFVARCFAVDGPEPRPTNALIRASSLKGLRGCLERRGLMRFPRQPGDDPFIVEVWL